MDAKMDNDDNDNSPEYRLKKDAPCGWCASEVPTFLFKPGENLCKYCAATQLGLIIHRGVGSSEIAKGMVQALHVLEKEIQIINYRALRHILTDVLSPPDIDLSNFTEGKERERTTNDSDKIMEN